MERYAWYITVVILLLCGVTFLLSSCIKEGTDGPNGPKVKVKFTINFGAFNSEEKVETRSTKYPEIASNVFRVATDVFMYATLEEEHQVTLRAYALNIGARVRIVAYSEFPAPAFTNVAGYADYTIIDASGGLAAVTTDLVVASGATYKFAAYSFNDATTSLPDHTAATPFNASPLVNPNDLLWGITNAIQIPVSSGLVQPVELTLDHLFARVRVVGSTTKIVNPSVNITYIEGAYITPNYSNLRFNAADGSLTPVDTNNPEERHLIHWREENSSSPWVTPPTPLNVQNVESDYYLIYTNEANVISLFIDNLVVNDGTRRDLGTYQFRFSNTNRPLPQLPLKPGHTYTLTLEFERQIWAGSNIFWDGTKLTFLPETTPPAQQGYQGVYFMWGSLVGISPVGTFHDYLTNLYIPIAGTGGPDSWRVVHAFNSTSNGWNGTTMNDIPHIRTGTLYSPNWLDDHSSRNYLYKEVHDDLNAGSTFIGDICHLLTQKGSAPNGSWRMPNARELGREMTEYTVTGVFRDFTPGQFTALEDGKYNLNNQLLSTTDRSFVTKNASNTIFPDGLSRDINGNINIRTRYLSGSPTSMNPSTAPNVLDACYNMSVTGNIISFTTNPAPLGTQGLVRCIKLDGGGIPINWITPTADVEDWDVVGVPFGQGDTNGQGNVLY